MPMSFELSVCQRTSAIDKVIPCGKTHRVSDHGPTIISNYRFFETNSQSLEDVSLPKCAVLPKHVG